MARARNIKPGFFTNGDLAEVPPLGRILFAGLWTIADREGRLEDRPKTIKGHVLPHDTCNVDKLLDELSKHHFIQRYEVDGVKYIQITKWKQHQNPHIKEAASTIPEPCSAPVKHSARTVQEPDENETSTQQILLIPSSLIPDSLNPSNPTSSASSLTTEEKIETAAPPVSENQEKPKPTRAGSIAMHLRNLGVDTASVRPEVIEWAERNVPDTILSEAVAMCKAKKPNERISSAFMVWAVEELLNPKPKKNGNAWWSSEKGIEAKAREVGCWPARGGESYQQLTQRIREKLSEQAA